MEDRLRLADTAEARLDAIREHRNRLTSLERQIRRYTESGAPIQPAEAFKVKYYRLEADQFLAEAGVDPDCKGLQRTGIANPDRHPFHVRNDWPHSDPRPRWAF